MKRKNGFTLVELLGVIVILAILSLITIPIISNMISDIRIKALRSSAYGLIEASNLYYAQYGNSSNIRFDINDNKVESSDTDNLISYKGSIKTGTIILDKKGKVIVCITDGKNSAYKNYNENKVTTSKGKICNIKENSNIVYLDDEATLKEYDNSKLTELVNDLTSRVDSLESENETLKEQNNNIAKEIYPVGSIYISMSNTNPSTLFGGEWEQLDSGYMLQSTSTSSNQKGGASTATFTPAGTVEDTTLSTNQIPAHTHTRGTMEITGMFAYRYLYGSNYMSFLGNETGAFYDAGDNGYSGYQALHYATAGATYHRKLGFAASRSWTGKTSSIGGSQSHTHNFTGNQITIDTVSPYITVYMYKRTA